MSNPTIIDVIRSIPDNQTARTSLSTISGQTLHLEGAYREGTSPRFFLVFPPKTLPKEINMAQQCLVSIRSDDTTPLSLYAKIEDIIGERTVEYTATSLIDPTKLRQYFRVAISVPLTISSPKESKDDPASQWSIKGETLDMSGSGILALCEEECKNRGQIKITLKLPSPQAIVSCIAHVISARRARKGRWHVAMHFDDIGMKQRDLILSNCLNEQRNQLGKGLQTGS
jgi:hypothetical protein